MCFFFLFNLVNIVNPYCPDIAIYSMLELQYHGVAMLKPSLKKADVGGLKTPSSS